MYANYNMSIHKLVFFLNIFGLYDYVHRIKNHEEKQIRFLQYQFLYEYYY